MSRLPSWPQETKQWGEYFDTYATEYEDLSFGSAGLGYVGEQEVGTILRTLASRPRGRVLDAGAGSGRLARALAADGWAVTALDVSVEMLGRVTREVDGCTGVHGALGTPLPFADASFDAIVCVRVLKYVKDLDRAIGEFARVLKPGGIAAVEFTNRRSAARFGYASAPTRLVTAGEARRLLERNGLLVAAREPGTRLPQPAWRWGRDPRQAQLVITGERVLRFVLGGGRSALGARSFLFVGARV